MRKLKSDRFLVSRNACFESAKRDFLVRQAYKKAYPAPEMRSIVGGQFREFNAASPSPLPPSLCRWLWMSRLTVAQHSQ